jgi:hypothetical protein
LEKVVGLVAHPGRNAPVLPTRRDTSTTTFDKDTIVAVTVMLRLAFVSEFEQ